MYVLNILWVTAHGIVFFSLSMCNIWFFFTLKSCAVLIFLLQSRFFYCFINNFAFVPKAFVLIQYGPIKVFCGMDLTILFTDLSIYWLYAHHQPTITSGFGVFIRSQLQREILLFDVLFSPPSTPGIWKAGNRRTETEFKASLLCKEKNILYVNASVAALHITKQQHYCF